MSEKRSNIIVVDDDETILFSFTEYFADDGYAISTASSLAEARKLLTRRFDVVLLDLRLPDGNGLELIPELKKEHPTTSIVVITGNGDIESAVEAMKRGADNFLTKPVNMKDLSVYLKKSLEVGKLRRSQSSHERLNKKNGTPYFGNSEPIRHVMNYVETASRNNNVVLLQGETGTGKGVIAKWIHSHSSRRDENFVEVNCSALKGDLLSSELFGHTKGAFTSAVKDREGLVEYADRGTLFLDEIGDMDLGVQAQLLKAIEERKFRRVGETRVRSSDFRLICATNKQLEQEVREGEFRKDLYYRINIFPIHVPCLRDRPNDIPGMAYHILAAMGRDDITISDNAMKVLKGYSWPGNIRELNNMLERAILLSGGENLEPAHFPGVKDSMEDEALNGDSDIWDINKNEKLLLKKAMDNFNNDTLKVSKAMGISRSALYRKLKKFDLLDKDGGGA